jgi:hypothetical protein
VGRADPADHPARPSGSQRLHNRLAGTNTFQDGVGAHAVGEFIDPRDAILATLGQMSVAPNSLASRWRDSCRLIAITRSAPS